MEMREEDLVEALQNAPQEGIRYLTEMYGGLVYAITWRRLQGRLPREDIEECVSDIFFELYRCRERIDLERGTLKAFLLTIAERQAIKYYERRTDKFDKVSLQEQMEMGLEVAGETDVEQETIQQEESARLYAAIQSLGEPTGSIVIQKYYYGMTAKEIGQNLGLSKNAVEKRLKRGLIKLKSLLGSR
ncbi:MAG: sigma-70 family RNA polymerase sigma factor [Lachnospiraceae bacterium]|nr:sigma-70 family RNA polymerase sigma factor [Lachnospiraceae bacterium]